MDSTATNALLLIASVRAALARNVRHYTPDGVLLETDLAIVTALLEHDHIVLDDSDAIPAQPATHASATADP